MNESLFRFSSPLERREEVAVLACGIGGNSEIGGLEASWDRLDGLIYTICQFVAGLMDLWAERGRLQCYEGRGFCSGSFIQWGRILG